MKALDLAKVEEDIRQAALPESTKRYLFDQVSRDRAYRLKQGRDQVSMCRHVGELLSEGRSTAFAIAMTAALFQVDEKTVRRVCKDYEQIFGENLFPMQLCEVS